MATLHPTEPPPPPSTWRGTKRPAPFNEGRPAKLATSPANRERVSLASSVSCGHILQPEDPPFLVNPITGGPMRPGPETEFNPEGAPIPSNEEFRLHVLKSYNILNTEPEPRFDRFTALASMIFHTPVALISLVDEHRQWFKSNVGFAGCSETRRTGSFCTYAILPAKEPVLVVCDALKDGRFCKNSLVTGPPHIRFYAGAPLISEGNFVLGSLCVIDFKPRESFSEDEQELLQSMADLVVMEIEKHTRSLELQQMQVARFEDDKRGLLQAIDAFDEGLVLCDTFQKGHPIVFVNEGWEKITGYSIQEVLGAHCGSLLEGPLTSVETKRALAKACKEGTAASVEILNYRKDGTPFWNFLRIRPVTFPRGISFASGPADGGNRYYIGIISDCTLRKEKELELEAIRLAELEAEASVRAKRSFVGNISHEIRTPMNAILACSQLLTDMADLSEEQRELSQMIQGSGQQLLSLINDILDFSKMDSGQMVLKPAEFNLWGCVDFCMEMLSLKCENKGLFLSYNVDHSVPEYIWADEVRLRQILTNLLSNAAKFTDDGGEIEVSVSAKRLPPGHEGSGYGRSRGTKSPRASAPCFTDAAGMGDGLAAIPAYRVTVSVRDTGIGIPDGFQQKLFDAFTQCDNSRTRLYEGTGLGLAISRDLAERMGGEMWVESEEGVGSIFYFTITVRGSMRPSAGASLPPEQLLHRPISPLTGKRALLVGAREPFHRMVGSMLRAWGVRVSVAASDKELCAMVGDNGSEYGNGSESGDWSRGGESVQCGTGSDVLGNGEAEANGRRSLEDEDDSTHGNGHQSKNGTICVSVNGLQECSGGQENAGRCKGSVENGEPSASCGRSIDSEGPRSDGACMATSCDQNDKEVTGHWGGAFQRNPLPEPGEGRCETNRKETRRIRDRFDVVVVDCPIVGRCSDPGSAAMVSDKKKGAVELMRRGCSVAEGVPTLLLMSKNAKNAFKLDLEEMRHVTTLSQPLRIKPLYTTLLQTLAPKPPPVSNPPTPISKPALESPGNQTQSRAAGVSARLGVTEILGVETMECSDPPAIEKPLRVTVVEDNLVNQRVLRKVLQALHYDDIRTASNGLEVLELLREEPSDVVLMDIQMPEMDGITATTRIRADFPEDQQPIIIALTADVGSTIEEECRAAGMLAYLSKPVRKIQLEQILEKCMYFKQHPEQRRTLKWIDV